VTSPEERAVVGLANEPGPFRQAAKRLLEDITRLHFRDKRHGVLFFISPYHDDDEDTLAFIQHLKQRIILERLVK
jgi:hypothetical protein